MHPLDVVSVPFGPSVIRPIGAYALSGLAVEDDRLLAVDLIRGYLLQIDPTNDHTTILNPQHAKDWINTAGLAISLGEAWLGKRRWVIRYDLQTFEPTPFVELPYDVDGVAVWDGLVYVTCQKSGYIHVFDSKTAKLLTKFSQPGVGVANLVATEDALWICDREEQTVFCLDRTTGELRWSALTPYKSPTAIALYPADPEPICYVAYVEEEPYVRDDPNARFPYQLTFRDRTWIHALQVAHNWQDHYTLSNGYLVELSYVEELQPLDALTLNQVEWRIALPSETVRQRVRKVEPIGHPFTIEEVDGQKFAVFKFDQLQPYQNGLLGWKALVELYSFKSYLTPDDVEIHTRKRIPKVLKEQYLVDNDELAMDTPTIQNAAKEAVGTETNILRKMLKIRNYVYDRLSYGIQPKIDTPDIALDRGIASCGEYVGVLLALARLNGIACRTVGRYKCPPHPDRRNLPLEPDFNHVWLEFYVPGVGWLPMESNVDDVIDRGPYPTRFFMGLAWYHAELGKGVRFEKMTAENLPENFALGDLALNHIRFTIIDELSPKV
ncbi:MAG: transglutaminase [Alkalinema sp. CACIAM 70d]|nr:MAG: transglutaminase [Alkalinema sp. CACIAM 70d]